MTSKVYIIRYSYVKAGPYLYDHNSYYLEHRYFKTKEAAFKQIHAFMRNEILYKCEKYKMNTIDAIKIFKIVCGKSLFGEGKQMQSSIGTTILNQYWYVEEETIEIE